MQFTFESPVVFIRYVRTKKALNVCAQNRIELVLVLSVFARVPTEYLQCFLRASARSLRDFRQLKARPPRVLIIDTADALNLCVHTSGRRVPSDRLNGPEKFVNILSWPAVRNVHRTNGPLYGNVLCKCFLDVYL